ncbi:MAG: WD40 repeat domain-containing protein [Candidatus Poribacteria bacterium]|nr:WD40 repeat domain-containing protein [Candidatus Poribacteria bacterium]
MSTDAQNQNTVSKLTTQTNTSQDYTQWHLPNGAIARLGKGEVNDIKFSPDGSLLAAATAIGIWLYDAYTGKEITMLPHPKKVNTLAFSNDGKTLAAGESEYQGYESAVRLWDLGTKKVISSVIGNWKEIKALAYTADGKNLVIAGGSKDWTEEIWTWNPTADTHQQNIIDLSHMKSFPGTTLALSQNGRFLANVVKSKNDPKWKIEMWDVNTGRQISTLDDSGLGSVSTMAFSTDEKTLVKSDASEIQFWDIETSKLSFYINSPTNLHTLTYSPDGTHIATGSRDGIVRMWKVPTDGNSILQRVWSTLLGKQTKMYFGHAESFRFKAITISPDNKMIASANTDGTIRTWDIDTSTENISLTRHIGNVKTIAFTENNKLASISLNYGQIIATLWNTYTAKELANDIIDEGSGRNTVVRLSPNGSIFATESANESVQLWDVTTNRFISLLKSKREDTVPRNAFERTLVFSPDNTIFARGHSDGPIQLWDLTNRHSLPTLEGHTGNCYRLVFAPDSKILASTNSDATTRLWDVTTNTEIAQFEGEERRTLALAFSPDGKTFANGVNIYRLDDKTDSYVHLYRLQNVKYNITNGLTFSPDARFLIASGFGKIEIWNATNGEYLSKINAHTGWIEEILFSPDGTILASRSEYDGTILLWDWEKIKPNTNSK